MGTPQVPDDLDRLVDAVLARLAGRLPEISKRGEPDPETPSLPFPAGERGTVGGLGRREHLAVSGVELTQSVQYNDVVSPAYWEANAVPLVALKTLVARVYPCVIPGMRVGGGSLEGEQVTGELIVSVGDRVVYRTGPTRTSAPG